VFLLIFVTISCSKKCVECAYFPNKVTSTDDLLHDFNILKVCEDEFDSKEEYNQATSVTEAFCCECK